MPIPFLHADGSVDRAAVMRQAHAATRRYMADRAGFSHTQAFGREGAIPASRSASYAAIFADKLRSIYATQVRASRDIFAIRRERAAQVAALLALAA
jgi:hypothetical protein